MLQHRLTQSIGATALHDDSRSDHSSSTRSANNQSLVALDPLWEQTVEAQRMILEQSQEIDELKGELEIAESELAEFDEQAGEVLDSLVDQHRVLESTARTALAKLGMFAVPVLVELLSDDRADVRGWSATVLGEIGPDAADAIPDLRILLSDPFEAVRRQAQESLAEIELEP